MSNAPAADQAPAREVALTAVGNRIIVAPAEPDLETKFGLKLINSPHKVPELGIVLGVGPLARKTHPQLGPGVPVYYPKSTGVEVVVNGQPVIFLRPEQLIGAAVAEPAQRSEPEEVPGADEREGD